MKKNKGKRDNVATWMEYKIWFKPSGAEATSILFLVLKLWGGQSLIFGELRLQVRKLTLVRLLAGNYP